MGERTRCSLHMIRFRRSSDDVLHVFEVARAVPPALLYIGVPRDSCLVCSGSILPYLVFGCEGQQ